MTLAGNLRENKAVYTVAGAGDFAVEKLREMPEQVTRAREVATKYQGEFREAATKYQGEVRETVTRYGGQVRETVERYRGEVQGRVDARELPGTAVEYATTFGTRAVEFIDELAERGRKVVHREAAEVAEITEAKPRTTRSAQPRTTRSAQPRTTRSAEPKGTAQSKAATKKTGS